MSNVIEILKSSNSFGIVSAYRSSLDKEDNQHLSSFFKKEVEGMGYSFLLLSFLCYHNTEKTEYDEIQSLLIRDIDPETLLEFACKYKCYRVLYKHDSCLELLSRDGRLLESFTLLAQQEMIETFRNACIAFIGCRKYVGTDNIIISAKEINIEGGEMN